MWSNNDRCFSVESYAGDPRDIYCAMQSGTAGGPRKMWSNNDRCFSVESYAAVLLAAEGRDNETDCLGLLHWADWAKSSRPGHPAEYEDVNVTARLIRDIRWYGCVSEPAIR
jgi:hypothetical protein